MLVSIPHPRTVETREGGLLPNRLSMIYLPPDSDALDVEAAHLLQAEITRACGRMLPISRAWTPPRREGIILLGSPEALAAGCPELPALPLADDPEAYALQIGPTSIYLTACTARGRLWAVQTLRQVLRIHAPELPGLAISDAPAMRYRGVLLDVARRKVPSLETLKTLVDTLSLLKLNMLQLQVEHTFQWRRHPLIGQACGSLSCEDILDLDAHCRHRGVELVPMLQSFGHMRNILMLEPYRHLAEHPALQWSLCAIDPASLAFMDELYEEYLPCFSSMLVNIGCDETVDLGKQGGRSNDEIARLGKGRVYVHYLLGLQKLLSEKYGKQVMCWGDVVLHYPELVSELPKDLIVLNWWYEAKARYDQVDIFAASGLPQLVCPGTSSWNTLFPRMTNAWQNVANFTRDGQAVGALGMLNTDWGDGGHYNLLGNSFYSYAHGAEVSWSTTPSSRTAFEATLGPAIFGSEGEQVVKAARMLGDICDVPAIQQNNHSLLIQFLFSSPLESAELRALPCETLETVAATALEAGVTLYDAIQHSFEPSAVADMAWSADAIVYAARKTAFFRAVMALAAGGDGEVDELIATGENLLVEHDATVDAFLRRWYAGNRHSEVDIALGRFSHAAEVLRIILNWLQEQHDTLAAHKTAALPAVPAYRSPWCEDSSTLWTAEDVAGMTTAMG